MIETKHYANGSSATGTAPLPDHSPEGSPVERGRPVPPHATGPATFTSTFQSELTGLINRFSVERGSNTPDYILAQYMADCLTAFERATHARSEWHGDNTAPETPRTA